VSLARAAKGKPPPSGKGGDLLVAGHSSGNLAESGGYQKKS